MSSLPERRRYPRFPFHSRGFLAIGEEQHLGTILDVSLKGALFSSVLPVAAEVGQVCRLEIFHAGQEQVCSAGAVVAYRREAMVGLELVEMDEPTQQVLRQVVDMHLGVPGLLERDLPQILGTEAAD